MNTVYVHLDGMALELDDADSPHSVVNCDRCNGLPCIPSLAQWTPRQR